MTLTLQDQSKLAGNGDFKKNIRQAMITVAVSVLKEDPVGQVPGQYDLRSALAIRVLRDPGKTSQIAAFIFATHQGMNSIDPLGYEDAMYVGAVENYWDLLSGFNPLYVEE